MSGNERVHGKDDFGWGAAPSGGALRERIEIIR